MIKRALLNHQQVQDALKSIFRRPTFAEHRAPVTRRDFVKLGLALGGGQLMLPALRPNSALAHEVLYAGPSVPFVVLDLAGGAALASNFLMGKEGGSEDLCESYRMHGWNPRASGALDCTFGLPMSAHNSQILAGLKSVLPTELQAPQQNYIKFASVAHLSVDDTNQNSSSALHMISQAGSRGSLFSRGLGSRSSNSGGNSRAHRESGSYIPKYISNISDVLNLTSLGEAYDSMGSQSQAALIHYLQGNAEKYGLQEVFADLSLYGKQHTLGDPRQSPEATQIFLANGSNPKQLVQASISLNVLKKYTGPGCITIDGCDYHNGPAGMANSEAKDLEIGQTLGRIFSLAHSLKTPVFVQMISDGGIYANDSANFERVWTGDKRLHSMTVLASYDPNQKISFAKETSGRPLTQLGSYTNAGEVNLSTLVGGGPEQMAVATLINYLSINGLEGRLEQLSGLRTTGTFIEDHLLFTRST